MKLESTAAPAALPAWPGGDGSVLQLHFSWRRKHQTSPNTLTGPALDPGSPLTSRRAAGWGDRTVTLCWTCASGLSLCRQPPVLPLRLTHCYCGQLPAALHCHSCSADDTNKHRPPLQCITRTYKHLQILQYSIQLQLQQTLNHPALALQYNKKKHYLNNTAY